MGANGDKYVTVAVTINRVTSGAILIEDDDGNEYWIPRSLLHGADEISVRRAGETIELRMFRWKAEELGLEFTE